LAPRCPLAVPTADPRVGSRVAPVAIAGDARDHRLVGARSAREEDGVVTIKLHRCPGTWAKLGGHPCWKVQKALDEEGIQYEVVTGPMRRGKRDRLEALTGQRRYPAIEFDDGTAYRAESGEMAAHIREGKLFAGRS
jgi:Glutathione S-transferase, N-terminal domain